MSTRRPLRSLVESCSYQSGRGMAPKTIIHVGAAWGTQEPLGSFPEAYHILIDPLPVYEKRLHQLLQKYEGEYHPVALSDSPGRTHMRVLSGGELGAALATDRSANAIELTVDTLDHLLSNRLLASPIRLKTDCQGYDMHVMRGGNELLKRVDIAVFEVNMFHPTGRPDLPDFGDTIARTAH